MLISSETLSSFSLAKEGIMPLVNEYGYLFIHKKTGAKIIFFKEENERKSFNLVFDTPLFDSTGVRHIIEHSVLCGSKKYKSKDPFMDVRKGSTSKDMNAYTGINSTYYLYSTSNEKDFYNLMDFYMDACFNPAFITEKKIFEGEGWHYDIDENGDLIINGVVYNEMKKIMSDRGRVLAQRTYEDVWPNNYAKYVSGGDIKYIPKLTHEETVKYYKTYYRPSNSYLVICGKLDYDKVLKIIDDFYSSYDDEKVTSNYVSELLKSKIPNEFKHYYPANKVEMTNKEKIIRYVIKVDNDIESYEDILLDAFSDILTYEGDYSLDDLICKQNLARRVASGFTSLPCGGYILITCEGVLKGNEDKVKEAIYKYFDYIKTNGINFDVLKSFLKDEKYAYFRNDIKGYESISSRKIASALLKNKNPFEEDINSAFDYIEEKIQNDKDALVKVFDKFFDKEKIITIVFNPDDKLSVKLEKNEKERLARKKKAMSEKEIEDIKRNVRELNEFRLREDSKEVLDSIPKISISELSVKPKWDDGINLTIKDRPVKYFKLDTRGITTVRYYFDIEGFTIEELKVLNLIRGLLFDVDTKKFSTKKIYDMAKTYLLVSRVNLYFRENRFEKDNCNNEICVEIEFKNEDVKNAMFLMHNIFKEIEFQDKNHIINEMKNLAGSILKQLSQSPDSYIEILLRKNLNSNGYLHNEIDSVQYVNYLVDMAGKYEKGQIDFGATLRRVSKKLFSWSRFSATIISDDEKVVDDIKTKFVSLHSVIGNRKYQYKDIGIVYENDNVGVAVETLVNYVGVRYNFNKVLGDNFLMYKVITNILCDSYLWDNVRLLGGAYGCKVSVQTNYMTAISYRDPQYEKTLEVFNNIAEYLANFDEDITKYIVATYSQIESYNSLYFVCDRVDDYTRNGVSREKMERDLRQMIHMTNEDVRKFGRELLNKEPSSVCIASNEKKISQDKKRFDMLIRV